MSKNTTGPYKDRRSLGGLRKNPKHDENPAAPQELGRIIINADVILELHRQLQASDHDRVEASIATWSNRKRLPNGHMDRFTTLELRALGPKEHQWWEPVDPKPATLEAFFKGDYSDGN